MRRLLPLLLLAGALASGVAAEVTLDLAGDGWSFAVDPTDRGESTHWPEPDVGWDGRKAHPRGGWDAVRVPHDFLTDARYAYTGVAWYRRSFAVPADATDTRAWRLQFDTLFQRCRVWLNGRFVGAHEGGYTPFEFVVTPFLQPGRQNLLVIAVDNRVKFRALPGARSGTSANAGQYPWLNYGGILGGMRLLGHEPVWIAGQKIETQTDGDVWRLKVRVDLRNATMEERRGRVTVKIANTSCELAGDYRIAAGAQAAVSLEATLPLAAVRSWELSAPVLYESRASLDQSATADVAQFGFRTIAVREGQLQLNGRAMRWAGANRARGHPRFGGVDPDELVEQDLRLMKEAGLVFARIQHTAPGRNLLDWADRHGMLLVLEVGMWGYVSADQASPELRAQFEAEMRELIALAQNHPSVIGWSLGNEYESWTPEGVAWTRDMARFVKTLDATRPVTFAALGAALRRLRNGEGQGEHAFDHIDYISVNYYLPPAELPAFLDPVHTRWPGKPVALTEFGLRADRVKSETERVRHLDAMLAQVATRPWVCGLSFWAFNDYASRYPGTGDDGYRRWGLVDEQRQPRELYRHAASLLLHGLPLAPVKN